MLCQLFCELAVEMPLMQVLDMTKEQDETPVENIMKFLFCVRSSSSARDDEHLRLRYGT